MCVCIIGFVVVLFKMLSCNALSVVSGTCLFADCYFSSDSQETKTVSSWCSCSHGNTKVPEEHKFSYSKAAICKSGEGNYHDTCSS
jgi:hypothetical protein